MCDHTVAPVPDPSTPPLSPAPQDAGPARRRRHAGLRARRARAAGPAPGRLTRLRAVPDAPGHGLHDPPRPVRPAAEPGPRQLPYGDGLSVRPVGPGDRAAALALHERCSPDTVRRRYHGPVADADRYLGHLLDPRHGRTLAVATGPGHLVAIGHLLWDGTETEVALLVEDGWQRRGLGTLLLRHLVALARREGRDAVYAVTQRSDRAMAAAMRRLGLPLDVRDEDGTVVITAAFPRRDEFADAAEVFAPK